MSRRDLGTSIRRRGKTVDKPAMEQMLRSSIEGQIIDKCKKHLHCQRNK